MSTGTGTTLDTVVLRLETDDSDMSAGLRQAEQTWQAAGRRMEDVGRSLTTNLTLPLTAVGGAAMYTALEFDKAMRRISALAGIPIDQVDRWRNNVRELAVDYGISAASVAEALEGITRSGTKGADAIDTLRSVVQASAAGLAPLQTMTQLVTGALDAYQRQGLTAAQATDILASGVRQGTLRLEEFGSVLSRVNGAAAALGVSFADVVGTLGVFAQSGAEPNEAASQLLAVMNALLRTSDPAEKALTRAGLSVETLRAQLQGPRGLVTVMRSLDEAFKGNSEALNEVIPNLGGFRAVMNALAQDGAKVDGTLNAVANSTGQMAAALAAADGPSKNVTKAMQRIKDALIGIGSTIVAPAVVPAIDSIGESVEKLGDRVEAMPKWMQTATAAVAGFGIALGPAVGALAKLNGALSLVRTSQEQTFKDTFQKVRIAFQVGPLIAFRNALHGIYAAATTLMTNPLFLAAAAIALGLTLITTKWLDMRAAVRETEQAMRDAAKAMDDMLGSRTPEQAARQLPLITARRQAMTAQLVEAQRKRDELKAWRDERFDGNMVKSEFTGRINWNDANKNRDDLKAAEARVIELQANMTEIRRQYNILATLAAQVQPATPDAPPPPPGPAVGDVDAIKDALTALDMKLKQARAMSQLLGAEFNLTEAEAQAYADAIGDLTAAGAPLDASLDANGTSVRKLGASYLNLKGQLDSTRAAQDALNDIYNLAASAVRDATTPQMRYDEVIRALEVALQNAKISQEQFNLAVQRAKDVLKEATDQSSELKQALLDMVSRSVDGFIDMAFEGKQSFGEFIESALRDIAKLIIKLELMRWLVGEGLKGGQFGGLLGVIGGLLPGGAGAAAGASGALDTIMKVAPNTNPALRAAAVSMAPEGAMNVNVNVNAVDRRDVASFFEENESLVAMAMLRARNKSAALRRALSTGG